MPSDSLVSEPQRHIMVVDDQPANLRLLEDMLRGRGYRVLSFPRGRHALAAAAQNPPDLILLDINMPEMDGYEVCNRLKTDAALRQVPVIFLSALNDVNDKLKAFQAGAVDYITKPFQFEEVQARVDAHSELYRLQKELRRHNDRLEELVGERTSELAQANARLRILDKAKTDFLSLISHELRTPIGGILGIGELLLQESGGGAELRDMFEQSRRRILTMIEDAAVLSEIELGQAPFAFGRVALAMVLEKATAQAAAFAQSRQVEIERPHDGAACVYGVEDLLVKALRSLVETAARFGEPGSAVRLGCAPGQGNRVEIAIESRGRTIPESVIPRFFDVLSIGEAVTPDGDFGLGPAVAHRILSLFEGTVAVQNREDNGIRLTVSLKAFESKP